MSVILQHYILHIILRVHVRNEYEKRQLAQTKRLTMFLITEVATISSPIPQLVLDLRLPHIKISELCLNLQLVGQDEILVAQGRSGKYIY